VFIASLLGELPRLGDAPCILVLDDFHAVDDSEDALTLVTRLLKESPPWLRFVISSRRRPSLELARLAGMGEVAEISTDDLRFTGAETELLFADGYGLPLDSDVLRELGTRTRGWAASLQLFHGSIRGRPSGAIRTLAKTLSGASGPIYDFLAQEVLNNLPADLEEFLVRAALLDRIFAPHAAALFGDRRGQAPTEDQARRWIDDGDQLGLLSRISQSSDVRQLHPLLRDFLLIKLRQRHSTVAIRGMHLGLARAVEDAEPLVASRHFIEAGEQAEAMRCLGRSVMLTMGSGQWGIAAALIDGLDGVPRDPAVAAIRARRNIEEGDLAGAGEVLSQVDLSASPPYVRAVVRHTRLALGWRTGDRHLLFETLRQIEGDVETPRVFREIFDIYVDAGGESLVDFGELANRLQRMAKSQAAAGHTYFAAISLHNAAIAESVAGNPADAVRLCEQALDAFDRLSYPASERYSTHAVLAACWLELGELGRAEEHIHLGLESGGEHADVPAGFAYLCARIGERERAERMLTSADALERRGLSDLEAAGSAALARAFLQLAIDPKRSLELMAQQPRERPLDVGNTFEYDQLVALAMLLTGDVAEASRVARPAHQKARLQAARGAEVRFGLIVALLDGDSETLSEAIARAASVGHLALLELADALGPSLPSVNPLPQALHDSIRQWPKRWLPILRAQMARGNVPAGRTAALLLDEHGDIGDVVRLRAFAKTYSRRGRVSPSLGTHLAKTAAHKLEVLDLGRVRIRVGGRTVELSSARRKPASLLMFLITRPNFTATREQVLEELWPDTDPTSASNSLNQSLYFLRRDIDPWYEDDISVEYVAFEGDLVWLDGDLVRASSVDFIKGVRAVSVGSVQPRDAQLLLDFYAGHFAPEFEYEDWASAWRSRVHACFLEFAHGVVKQLIGAGAFADARDVALRAFEADPEARELERTLIALYWRLGARSAANAQYNHFAAQERADGFEPVTLSDLCQEELGAHQ
jgi:DNA-binding SARP family transcriptional activator